MASFALSVFYSSAEGENRYFTYYLYLNSLCLIMNTQSSVDTRIKVGIIGFGRMGRFYWEAMTKSDRWNIAYICDTDPESRQLAKELAPGSLIVEDNQKIFEDESVQVVGLFTLADSRMGQIWKTYHCRKACCRYNGK